MKCSLAVKRICFQTAYNVQVCCSYNPFPDGPNGDDVPDVIHDDDGGVVFSYHFDSDKDAFAPAGWDLLVLPGDAFVAVVKAEAGGDGVAQVFARAIKVVIVESSPAQADEADDQAARAAALSAMCRRRCPSERLRDGGRYGTNSSRAGGWAFPGIFGGKLGGDPGAQLGREGFKFQGHWGSRLRRVNRTRPKAFVRPVGSQHHGGSAGGSHPTAKQFTSESRLFEPHNCFPYLAGLVPGILAPIPTRHSGTLARVTQGWLSPRDDFTDERRFAVIMVKPEAQVFKRGKPVVMGQRIGLCPGQLHPVHNDPLASDDDWTNILDDCRHKLPLRGAIGLAGPDAEGKRLPDLQRNLALGPDGVRFAPTENQRLELGLKHEVHAN